MQDPSNLFHQLNRGMPLGLESGLGRGGWERVGGKQQCAFAGCLVDFCALSEFVIRNELHHASISKYFLQRHGDNLGITDVFDKSIKMCFYSPLCSHKQTEWPISFVINLYLKHISP